jgi:hypothetical protein
MTGPRLHSSKEMTLASNMGPFDSKPQMTGVEAHGFHATETASGWPPWPSRSVHGFPAVPYVSFWVVEKGLQEDAGVQK